MSERLVKCIFSISLAIMLLAIPIIGTGCEEEKAPPPPPTTPRPKPRKVKPKPRPIVQPTKVTNTPMKGHAGKLFIGKPLRYANLVLYPVEATYARNPLISPAPIRSTAACSSVRICSRALLAEAP